eukprot:4554885-Pyramimonas_sp.AAC.1
MRVMVGMLAIGDGEGQFGRWRIMKGATAGVNGSKAARGRRAKLSMRGGRGGWSGPAGLLLLLLLAPLSPPTSETPPSVLLALLARRPSSYGRLPLHPSSLSITAAPPSSFNPPHPP